MTTMMTESEAGVDVELKMPPEPFTAEAPAAPTVKKRAFKTECSRKAYGGYVLCERGFGGETGAGIIVPASVNSEDASLVLSVGPSVKLGCQVGDFINYSQGTKLIMKGPNGGTLFCVPENMIIAIEPAEGTPWPREAKAVVEMPASPVPPLPGPKVEMKDRNPFTGEPNQRVGEGG